MRLKLESLSREVLGAAFRVLNTLGCGFLEKVYENALAAELAESGLCVAQQAPITVCYRGKVVGEYFADLVVERSLVVELKAARGLDSVHEAQCLNYLKASGLGVGLLINLGRPRLEYRRFAHGPLA